MGIKKKKKKDLPYKNMSMANVYYWSTILYPKSHSVNYKINQQLNSMPPPPPKKNLKPCNDIQTSAKVLASIVTFCFFYMTLVCVFVLCYILLFKAKTSLVLV